MESEQADRYWALFVELEPDHAPHARYRHVFAFGTRPEEAVPVAELAIAGIKTTTASLAWSYAFDGKRVPAQGDFSIVTDATGRPLCVIETTEVRMVTFEDVDEGFARDGGEGDRTLESWRRMYWSYIVSECERIGRKPSRRAPLVCERFEVLFSDPFEEGG